MPQESLCPFVAELLVLIERHFETQPSISLYPEERATVQQLRSLSTSAAPGQARWKRPAYALGFARELAIHRLLRAGFSTEAERLQGAPETFLESLEQVEEGLTLARAEGELFTSSDVQTRLARYGELETMLTDLRVLFRAVRSYVRAGAEESELRVRAVSKALLDASISAAATPTQLVDLVRELLQIEK